MTADVQDSITTVSGNSGTVQFSASGAGGGTPATPAAATPAAVAAVATSPVAAVATPPPSAAVTAAAPLAQAPPLQEGSFYVENYAQCGGERNHCFLFPKRFTRKNLRQTSYLDLPGVLTRWFGNQRVHCRI